MSQYTSGILYEEAFETKFTWSKWLPANVFKFHDYLFKAVNTPVELQMGIILPFISSLCGPKTRCIYKNSQSVLNLYWVNVAASGSGKSTARSWLISEPLNYLLSNTKVEMEDFEVSRYTRAVTDEGLSFFDDLKKKERQNESDLGLLNQLYDGQGDKTTLAQRRQRCVPKNATCISVSIQQEAFLNGLSSLGKSSWLDNGFGERFLISACHPYQFDPDDNDEYWQIFHGTFSKDFIGKVALGIFELHRDNDIVYILDDKAKKKFNALIRKFNAQFNLKYTGKRKDIPSQEVLDAEEKSQISVRTKASQLIGRLSFVLWIYAHAFECVFNGKDVSIPCLVTEEYVCYAEQVVNTSYVHSETFSSSIFSKSPSVTLQMGKPKVKDFNRVVNGMIKYQGAIVNIRLLSKNIRNLTTELVKDELQKLVDMGIGTIVTKEKMEEDKFVTPLKRCALMYFKPYYGYLNTDLFDYSTEADLRDSAYLSHFDKSYEEFEKTMIRHYHPHYDEVMHSQIDNSAYSNHGQVTVRRKKFLGNKKKFVTALDFLSTQVDPDVDPVDQAETNNQNISADVRPQNEQRKQSTITRRDYEIGEPSSVSSNVFARTLTPWMTPSEQVHSQSDSEIEPKTKEVTHVSETSHPESDFASEGNDAKKKKLVKFAEKKIQASNDDTESDSTSYPFPLSQAEPNANKMSKYSSRNSCLKTLRWRRPPPPKPDEQEVLKPRKSKRIADKKQSENEASKGNGSSTDVIPPTSLSGRGKKRKLSISQRNEKSSRGRGRGKGKGRGKGTSSNAK